MEARTWQSRAGGAARLVAAVAALASPPSLLAVTIGNPLPSWPINWARVVEAVQAGLVPSSFWVNVLALAAWSSWAVLVGMLAVEVVAVVRDRPSPAGVPGWIRHLAQALVAAAIALAGPGHQALALSGAAGFPVLAAAPAVQTLSVEAQPVAEGRMVTVAEGDSWGGFAADVLGDASLGPELRAANVGRDVGGGATVSDSTVFVEPGWGLLIPAHLGGGSAAADLRAEADVPDGDTAISETWRVERGDHFWDIAEATLTEQLGRAPTDRETGPYWQDLIEANRGDLLPPGDPDLIYPGQEFVLPSPPRAPAKGITGSTSAPPPVSTDSVWRTAVGGAGPAASVAAETPVDRDGWQAAVEGEPPPSALDLHEDPEEDARTALGVPVGLPAGLAAAGLLAAGVVATLRWRRRTLLQQRAPGMRLPTPLPEADNEIAKLDAAAVPEETLDDLAALLASIPLDVHPVLVRVSDDGQVTLLFDERAGLPDPPPPWTLADDGADGPVGWQARIGDRGPGRSFGLPLLVTLGRSGTSTVLANVGAMGTLALDGPPPEVRRRLRAMSLDLATSRVSFPVEVAVAGDDRLASLDRVRQIDDPASEVELALAEVGQVVIDDRVPRLLVCHHGTAQPEVPEELVGTLGVAAAGPADGTTWVLDIEDAHSGRLRLPDGGSVHLALPDIDAELLDDELDRLDEPELEPADAAAEAGIQSADPSTNGHAGSPGRVTISEPAWCEVRLLGPVEVVCNGARVEGLTPRTLEILVNLATHPQGVARDRIEDVIWKGAAAQPDSQRVRAALAKLRKILGDGPDGEPLLARRSVAEPIVLSEHVSTDLDRAFAHLDVARDLPVELRARELAAALELVRGEPLEGRAYSWATHICEQAIVRLQEAALEVARLNREAGDLDTAERAIEQGMKLLDPNGSLYVERAHLARLRGRPEQLPRIFEQYRRKLADDADEIAGSVATPHPDIELAFRELIASA